MGQYYKPIVLKENYENESCPCIVSLNTSDFYEGAKLMEHAYIGNAFVETFAQMIHKDNNNGLNNNIVVWCGDYGKIINDISLYEIADKCEVKNEYKKYQSEEPLPYKYILNNDTKQYVEINPFDDDDYPIHPLPLLISDGNGRGGGDYYGTDMDKVGIWAYNHVCVANDVPNDFTELKVNFKEEY